MLYAFTIEVDVIFLGASADESDIIKATSGAIFLAGTLIIETVLVHAYTSFNFVIVFLIICFASRWLAGEGVISRGFF